MPYTSSLLVITRTLALTRKPLAATIRVSILIQRVILARLGG
jgi:hypothetical protein